MRDSETAPRTLRVDGHVARERATATGPGGDRGTGTAGVADALGDTARSRGKRDWKRETGRETGPGRHAGNRRRVPRQDFTRDGQKAGQVAGKRRRNRKTGAGPTTGKKEARERTGNDGADTGAQRAKAGAIAGRGHEADRMPLRRIGTRRRHGGIRRATRKRTNKPSAKERQAARTDEPTQDTRRTNPPPPGNLELSPRKAQSEAAQAARRRRPRSTRESVPRPRRHPTRAPPARPAPTGSPPV